MKSDKQTDIGFFQKYLTVWVILCMVIGVLIGRFLPAIPDFMNQFEYAKVSIPMAVLIWLMIYPMMMKVDFQSIKNVGKNPKGLYVTWITNWVIKHSKIPSWRFQCFCTVGYSNFIGSAVCSNSAGRWNADQITGNQKER